MDKSQNKNDIRYAFIKVGMTSAFAADGTAKGVTVLKMQPAKVIRHEKLDDGRVVIVVEYDTGKTRKLVRGWVAQNPSEFEVGSTLKSPEFASGQEIKITGLSKGRGFQDAVTIHGFAGGPASHGSRFHRAPGSIGMRTEPGRVMKGKKMPRLDGQEQITLRNVHVTYWSNEEAVLAVAGGVPGSRGSVVFI
ncbi:MAG: 50S ribosomal protein L3 [Bdellovibrionota bacterium]